MLPMSFVSLLLGLARLSYVLIANPLMERQPPRIPPEPELDLHNFLPGCTRGRASAKRLLHLGLLVTIAVSNARIPRSSTWRAPHKSQVKYWQTLLS
jgi:hypothetical protein